MVGIIQSGRFGAAVTTPPVTGYYLWFDASDAASFTYSSGTVVSQWNDKSGNTRHLTQGTVLNQPTRSGTQNGLPTVVFDGSNDALSNSSIAGNSSGFTLFIAGKMGSGTSAYGRILSSSAGGTDYTSSAIVVHRQAGGSVLAGERNAVIRSSSTMSMDAWHAITVNNDMTTSRMYIDGVIGSTAGADTVALVSSVIALGRATNGGDFFAGEIAEVLLYLSFLNTTDRQSVEAYLKTKWGTP